MTISVLKDFKIFDAGSKSSVEEIIKRISINSDKVILNLSRCIIDYPATSLILDKILLELSKTNKPARLTIQTHLNIMEALLLHWLFIGSVFFEIDDSKKKNTVEEFKKILTKKLNQKKLKIEIQIIAKDGNILKNYLYGED